MGILLRLSDLIEALLRRVADAGAWAFIACIVVIVFDVVTRKVGFQLPGLGSTRLQELEWHLHAVLFCTWLGYTYVRNGHVRIDVFTASLAPRSKLWLELACCIVFALPYLWIALPYAHDFFLLSFRQAEGSDAPTGLPYRWVVKFFLYFAFISVLLAVIAVMARCVVALFGTAEQRSRAYVPFARPSERAP
ncbi:MAG TPA: TRAP transporter small permease subunit [Burkholderiaceae bacterium]|jgi:TRAP-type mannitol/chloroaromatic compound transport system permease small subunit|nr:TRAP transporter small permease subunit [Burkholderiaceae bacterium]